jgi:SNF2 family DNA or RNA helicase
VEAISLIMADDENCSDDQGGEGGITLVVGPMSLLAQWRSEIFRHTTLEEHEARLRLPVH